MRAYCLLIYRKRRHGTKNPNPIKANVMATPPRYLSFDEANKIETTRVTDFRHPGEELFDEQWLGDTDDRFETGPYHLENEEFVENVLDCVSTNADVLENYMLNFSTTVNQSGRGYSRPPLTNEQRERFLLHMGRLVKVKHDSWRKATIGPREDDPGLAMKSLFFGGSDGDEEATINAKDFWEFREKLSSCSATTLPFERCLQMFGYRPEKEHADKIRIQQSLRSSNPKPWSSLKPNPWQITGAAWMMAQEGGPIGGGLVADDCGVGKTILIFLHLVFQAQRREREYQQDPKSTDCRPTLILCPNNLLAVWVQEWSRFFSGVLNLRVYYGVEKDANDTTYRNLMLPRGARELRREIKRKWGRSSVQGARTVILSAYDTFAQRTLTTRSGWKEEKDLADASRRKEDGKSYHILFVRSVCHPWIVSSMDRVIYGF